MTEEELKAWHSNPREFILGRAKNITSKELEGKDTLEKVKYIFEHGYVGEDQITLIKTIWILTKEVADLRKEINELKQQLSK